MISIDLNILENAPGQLHNFDFDSMVVFNGNLVLAGANGIMQQDNSGSDNGEEIDAWAKTGNTDFQTVRQKRLRKAYVTYEAYGAGAVFGAYFDETLEYSAALAPTNGVQESARVNCRRDGKGSILAFQFSNVGGSDFSISALELTPVLLGPKPK